MKTLEEAFNDFAEKYRKHNRQSMNDSYKDSEKVKEESSVKKLLLSNFSESNIKSSWKSQFICFNDVNALSQGCFNLVVGRTGKGKTDLIISMAYYNLLKGRKVAIFISEGEVSDFHKQFSNLLKSKKELYSKIAIFDENSGELSDIDDPVRWNNKIIKILREYESDIFYFDNLSTLRFTNSTPDVESKFIKDLASKARMFNICFIALIHTTKTYHPIYEIGLEGIRGNASHVNLASNIFALNNYNVLDKSLRTIKILKSRNFGEKVGESYQIFYKKLKFRGFYEKDVKISENEARRYFALNNRQKLSGRN